MLFFLDQDLPENASGSGVVVIEVGDDFAIAVDGDTLGDQILGDHILQGLAFDVFGTGVPLQAVRIEVRLVVWSHDAFGQLVDMLHFPVGVLEELGDDDVRLKAGGHEVVAFVAQEADQLGDERFVEQAQDGLAIGRIAFGDRALLDVFVGTAVKDLDVRQLSGGYRFSP